MGDGWVQEKEIKRGEKTGGGERGGAWHGLCLWVEGERELTIDGGNRPQRQQRRRRVSRVLCVSGERALPGESD